MVSQKVGKRPFLSFRRKPESSLFMLFWTPAPRLREDRLRGSDDLGDFLRTHHYWVFALSAPAWARRFLRIIETRFCLRL